MYLIIHDIVGKCVISVQFVAGDTLHHLLVDLSQLLLIEMGDFFCSVFIVCAAKIVYHIFYFILFNFNLLMLWQ